MAVHVTQWAVVFIAATWLTAKWLLSPPASRWRHIVAGVLTTVLWVPLAYTAGNVETTDGSGGTVAFGSEALGTFATFAAVVSAIGLLVGLVLWVEETADEAHSDLPPEMQHRRDRGD